MNRLLMMTALAGCLATELAHAANTQFNKGPVCVDKGVTVSCNFKLTGLGNADVLMSLRVLSEPVDVSTSCKNPKGKASPGQNPAAITDIGGDLYVDADDIRNGSLTTSLTSDTPPAPSWSDAGCPNSQWKAAITDVHFQGETIEITVMQNGAVVAKATDVVD